MAIQDGPGLAQGRERVFERRRDILRWGDTARIVHRLTSGFACRYRMLRDGRRQITAILVPGDLCDLQAVMSERADFSLGTLTRCRLAEVPIGALLDGGAADGQGIPDSPLLAQLRRDEAIAREWLVSLGRRNAIESLAHLFCELRWRLAAVGLARETSHEDGHRDGHAESYELGINQTDLADALGMTNVHVNRSFQVLRRAGLIEQSGGVLTLLDRPALERLAQFDPNYLRP